MTLDPETFENFEIEQSLFEITINNVPIWERIRHNVYRSIEEQFYGLGQAQPSPNNYQDYLDGIYLFLKNMFIRNPYTASNHSYIFFHSARRAKHEDGFWWDIYCDPIYESCELDYIHMEKPYSMKHWRPPRTDNLRYTDLIIIGSEIQKKIGINTPSIPPNTRDKLRQANNRIHEIFEVNIDLVDKTIAALHNRNTRLWMYERLLKRINPSVVVVVSSYNQETLIEACNKCDVTVVEIQHGVIHSSHFGYSYKGARNKVYFPDYLLTWGDFWSNNVDYPISDNKVKSVGFPYLEQNYKQYMDISPNNQLLFISQGSVGRKLSKFAIKINRHPEFKWNIVYKLHPGEYDRWQSDYPWLKKSDIEVIDNSENSLYELFAGSKAQIGVSSTAIYEGLMFDLETYIFNCKGTRVVTPLIEEGVATTVDSVEELLENLGRGTKSFNQNHYFKPNSSNNICDILNSIK